jgi:putative phosphoribosyl transferase
MIDERFENRSAAGKELAARLEHYRDQDPIVLALPRGGVEVGYEVALALGAPLDVFIARKLGAPHQPELGIGAVAQGGVLVLDTEAVRVLGITDAELERITERETEELERRVHQFRGDRPPPIIKGRTVILVDDGLATGVTAYAAIRAIEEQEPARLVLAVPVCAASTATAFRARVGELICVKTPPDLGAVGLWYRNFEQTTEEEVVRLLADAHPRTGQEPSGVESRIVPDAQE